MSDVISYVMTRLFDDALTKEELRKAVEAIEREKENMDGQDDQK